MPADPQTFAQTVAQALNAVMEATVGGISKVAGTNWAYTKDGDLAYDNERIPLDEDARALVEEALKNDGPYYINNIDSLLFGTKILVSPNGLVELPDDFALFPCEDVGEDASIFIVTRNNAHNFLAIRNVSGEYHWSCLFRRWGAESKVADTETGTKLILKRGKETIASLTLPEMELHEKLLELGSFADPRDSKTYKTVKIGKQTWMAENLNWEGAGWCYDDDPANGDKYGRLYTWDEAMESAPAGWHLPTDEEWKKLEKYVGAEPGAELKSADGWDGMDGFGFSALPGGYRGTGGSFLDLGSNGYWWSATHGTASSAWYRYMNSGFASVNRYLDDKGYGFSVRLVKD